MTSPARTVAVQGLGSVGFGSRASRRGARVLATDVNPERIEHAVSELGIEVVDSDEIYGVECDVFAPCALGGVLNDDTIARLRCAVIAGAANNQLLDEVRHGEMLRERGIVYAPDYVINAGGVINISCELRPGGYDADAAAEGACHPADARGSLRACARARDHDTRCRSGARGSRARGRTFSRRVGDARPQERETPAPDRARAARRRERLRAPPASAPTRSSSPTASANALWARSPPNGTSSSGDASPASTSPCVTAPIDTSETSTRPSLEGIAIASGFVPVSGGPPPDAEAAEATSRSAPQRGLPRRGGEPSSRARRLESNARRRRAARAPAAMPGSRSRSPRGRGSRARRLRPSARSRPRGPPAKAEREVRRRASRATGLAKDRDPSSRAARRPRSGRAEQRPRRPRARGPRAGRVPRRSSENRQRLADRPGA